MAVVSLVSSSPDVRLGHRGPLVVSCFLGWPSGASLRAVAAAQRQVATQYGKVLSIAIIPPIDAATAPPLNLQTEQRDASLKVSAEVGEQVAATTIASAMVIMPRGLVAVMVNSFMAAVTLVMRAQTPLKTFRTLPEAVAWLEQQPNAPKLPGAVRDLEVWLGLEPGQVTASNR